MIFSKPSRPLRPLRAIAAGVSAAFIVFSGAARAEPAAEAAASPSPSPAAARQLEIPVVEGEDTLGIRVPYHDESGRLVMELEAEIARKSSGKEIEMQQVGIEFFDEDGEKFSIVLPRCTFDLETRILSGEDSATISRNDFRITGRTIHFEMENQRGRLGGPVTMTLYNIDPTKE